MQNIRIALMEQVLDTHRETFSSTIYKPLDDIKVLAIVLYQSSNLNFNS